MPTVEELKKQSQYVLMSEEEAWEFLESHEQQIASLTTMNKKGWPITVPIIFLAHNKKVYFTAFKWRGNVLHRKIRDIANNPIVSIMSEAGWNDTPRNLRFVCVVGTAKVIADPDLGDVSKIEGFWHKFQEKHAGRRSVSPGEEGHSMERFFETYRGKMPSDYIGLPREDLNIYYEVTPIRIYTQAGYSSDDRLLPGLTEQAARSGEVS